MDTSLSAKKDKNKGKSKKYKRYKKDKKEKKEKKGKEKQTISIDLTSPPRAHTPPPPDPDAAAPTAAHTPTRAPSRQNGKRGRSTTQREEAQPASTSRNKHTYNSRSLPLFSSNDSTGPPSTGQLNAVRPRAKSAAAIPDRSRTNDIERSSYNHDCKIKTLETCLSLKDRYLAMPPAVQTDQEPFWTGVRDFLERRSVTRGKLKDWQAVQRAVESWCQPRRSSMREDRLPAVSQSHPELDELVDQWNLVFAQRFCKIHMGYFTAVSRERINSTILPSQTTPAALQRPPSSLAPTPQIPPPSFTLPARPSPSAIPNDPAFSRGSHSTKPLEKSGEGSSRKRKDLDLSARSSLADTRARTNSRDSRADFKGDNKRNVSSHDRAKRPRLDSHSSDFPPASNFALGGRDSYGARTPSSQRPLSPPRPKTSYGPIETQGEQSRGNPDKITPMTPCPTGPGLTNGPRTDVPRPPVDSYQTHGNSQSNRHHGQRRDDRQIPGDYYRPDYMSRRRSNW